MYLVAGLGNPSPKYDHTPHNLGREAVLRFAVNVGMATGETPEPNKLSIPGFNGQAFRGIINDEEVVVVPDLGTFMNESGSAVQTILAFFKIEPTNIILVHDELALPLGTLRLGRNLSAAGHNGVQSVINTIGTQDFMRMRLGVETRPDHQIPSEELLLRPFPDADRAAVDDMITTSAEAISVLLETTLENAMTKFN